MGFFGIGTPKWKHKDPAVRRAALERLHSGDEHILVKVAIEDADEGIRATAAAKVQGEANLKRLSGSDDAKVAGIARSRLAGVAQRIVKEGRLAEVRGLLDGIKEQSALAEIACTAQDAAVRVAALDHLLALEEPSPTALATVAIQDASGDLAGRAVERIAKKGVLKDIARKAKHEAVRARAQALLDVQGQDEAKPSTDQRRRARRERLEALTPRFGRVVVASVLSTAQDDFDLAAASLDEILAEYDDLDGDDAVATAERKRAQAAQALEHLRAEVAVQAQAAAEAVSLREAFIERVTDGTEAGDRAAIELAWESLTAVPTEIADSLDARFAEAVAARFRVEVGTGYRVLSDDEAKDLAEVADTAEGLIEKAGTKAGKDAEFTFQDLHKRWSALTHGTDPQLPDRLRFLNAWNAYKDRRRQARDERNQAAEAKLADLRALVEKAEAFAAEVPAEDQRQGRFDALKQLRADWRKVGFARGMDPLRDRFEAALDRAFEPLQELRAAEDWERFANATKAEVLTDEIKGLASEADLPTVARTVKQAHQRWKAIGPLPRERQQALWLAFKAACDEQFDRCRAHFAEQDAQRAEAKVRKERIVEEAKRLTSQGSQGMAGSPADRAAKEQTAQRLKDLQAEWKDAGRAPREVDDALWQEFRAACDGFFQAFNAVRDSEFSQNLLRKEAIATELDKLAETVKAQPEAIPSERERWLRHVKDLQARWKGIGHVPRDKHGDLNARYRAACDVIYDSARATVTESSEELAENLAAKQDLCARLEALRDQDDAISDAEQLRLRWEATGPVPNDERKAIEERWREAWAAISASR